MTNPVQTLDDLIALKTLLADPEHWIRNRYYLPATIDKPECYCTVGAIGKVIGFNRFNHYITYEPRARAIMHAMKFDYPHSLIAWNDSEVTTHKTLMTRIERSIRELRLLIKPDTPTTGRKFGSKDKKPRKKK
jgi:hypothetical protein